MAPEETQEKKPGFFSRLFGKKHVPEPPSIMEESAPPPAASATSAPEIEAAPAQAPAAMGALNPTVAAAQDPPAPATPSVVAPGDARDTSAPVEEVADSKPGFFARLKERLGKTKASIVARVRQVIGLSGKVDEEVLERIEEILIQSDVGPRTTERITARMRQLAGSKRPEGSDQALAIFKEVIEEIICKRTKAFEINTDRKPYVVLVVGVNGAGKTTTIGKMAARCTRAGLKTMLVAGDTFRAAAVDQLEIWAKRTGCGFVRGKPNADPASVCYDGLVRAKSEGADVVFIDTAGRLHTKVALMEELKKVYRVIQKAIPDAPHETLLVLDATTGQNALQQTKLFSEAAAVSGLVMTKLDGTAKGGVLIAIRDQFDIPVTLIGIGEGQDDLRDFDPKQFVEALFSE